MSFNSAYSPKVRQQIHFEGKGRTRQSFKAECDVNNIMARFRKTGVIDFVTRYQPQYGDVTAVEFTEAMNTVAQAKSMFFGMPAHVRDRFENKPEAFLEFVQNPNNKDEARALGLLKPEEPSTPVAGSGLAASGAAPAPAPIPGTPSATASS